VTRLLGTILAVVALLTCGFFVNEALRVFGVLGEDKPGGPPPGVMGMGSGGYPGAGDDSAVAVEVTAAMKKTVRERVSGSGILEPEREVVIYARVEGEVEELLVEEGAQLEAGAALCAIDESPLRIAEQLARIEMQQAVASFDRLSGLLESRSITPQEVDEARFARERAEAAYARAALDLEHARPTAPFAGTIVDRAIELGQTVRSGDPLFTLADFRPLRLRLFLPESVVSPIVVGQIAELRAERGGTVLTRGSVERVSPVVDRASLTVEVLIHFEFATGTIRPGSFGHVDVITRTEDDVVLVPRRAVVEEEGRSYLYVVDGERAHRTEIIPGYRDESVLQVREGISAGARIVTEGVRELSDGARVEIYREVPVAEDPMTIDADG
jgi:membrane fusion protein (multidrug efflux system)